MEKKHDNRSCSSCKLFRSNLSFLIDTAFPINYVCNMNLNRIDEKEVRVL
jgi:hypothetical protein